jgi:hypothetical protein
MSIDLIPGVHRRFRWLATDNCRVAWLPQPGDINMCGVGKVYRTFTATDDGRLQQPVSRRYNQNFDLFDESQIKYEDFPRYICDIDLLDPKISNLL